ncbi:MAG: hypothetical protein Q9228_006642 [Teloschistes exilis]
MIYCPDLAANERQEILPESPNGSVLVTARSREAAFKLVGNDEDILKVEPVSESYALALFRKKFSGGHEEEVLELLQHLDYMPLAISQAVAYIRRREPRTTVSKYLNDFQRSEKDRASLLNLTISFEYIQMDRPSAARLLSLMSFFDRQGIPEELIMSHYEENKSTVDFEKDIEVLRSFSLIALGIETDVFEMHRLVQFAMRKWLEQRQELEGWKEVYIDIMADAFPSGRYENWGRCQMLFPHAELMDRQALESREKVLGKEQPNTLTSVSNLALVLQYQGKYDEAEQINRRPLDGREKVLGKEHPNTLTSVSNLALMLQHQGKYDEAEHINRRALDGREKVLGKEHPDTLMSVSNLALMLQHQGKYDEAEQMNRRALDGSEKVLGKEHPDTLTSVYCLAYLLQQQQRYHMAQPLYERALAGYKKVF